MNELISLLLIGISLSMDTFSLSLTLGIYMKEKISIYIPLVVGIFHFFMPILGFYFSKAIFSVIKINTSYILGIILIFLAINLIINFFNKEEINFKNSFIGIIIFAFGVSLDSFSVGIGINTTNYNLIVSGVIFSICSFIFTYIGLIIGKYSNNYIGNFSKILGIILLILTAFFHVF